MWKTLKMPESMMTAPQELGCTHTDIKHKNCCLVNTASRKDQAASFLKCYPSSWMVYFMEHRTKIDDKWGVPIPRFWETSISGCFWGPIALDLPTEHFSYIASWLVRMNSELDNVFVRTCRVFSDTVQEYRDITEVTIPSPSSNDRLWEHSNMSLSFIVQLFVSCIILYSLCLSRDFQNHPKSPFLLIHTSCKVITCQ